MAISRYALALGALLLSSFAFAFPEDLTVTLSSPAGAAEFGYALAVGDLNGDEYPDLVVGAPGNQGGSLYIYAGGEGGLATEPFWSLTLAPVMPGGSGLGTAISIDDADGDDIADLVVLVEDGAPGGPFPYAIPGTDTGEGPLKVLNALPPDTEVDSVRSLAADFDLDDYEDGAVGDPEAGTVAVRYTDSPFVNDPPVWQGQTVEVRPEAETGTVLGAVEAFDPEGGPLTFDKTDGSLTGFVSLDRSTGVLRITDPSQIPIPEPGETLAVIMPVLVSDGEEDTINEVEFEIEHRESDLGVFIGPCFLRALGF